MSDHVTSGEPTTAPAETAGAAPVAASSGNSAPIGSFGTAKGSGLSRGKRATPPAAASAAATGSYQPTSVEVITSQSEYKNPFTGETTVRATVNEPAPQAALQAAETAVKAIAPAAVQPAAAPDSSAPTATPARAVAPASAPADELFPFAPSSGASAPVQPAAASAETTPAVSEKAELNILPPADVKRPAVSWGEEGVRDERPTFRPERREARPFEAREPKPFQPREPKAFAPREPKPFQPREPRAPRADFANGAQGSNHAGRDQRPRDRQPAAAAPAKKSGGFLGWLKGLFGAEPSVTEQPRPGTDRGDQRRDDGEPRHNRRRHRGGRGRNGYQGENRGPRPEGQQNGDRPRHEGGAQGGERRSEGGGGGRRRSRGGRGRGRNGGGPRPEGHQGGGAI